MPAIAAARNNSDLTAGSGFTMPPARMAEMVQNLLDANRIERGEMQLNLAPTDLGPALTSVVETQRPHATAKQQTIHLEGESIPVVALLDPSITGAGPGKPGFQRGQVLTAGEEHLCAVETSSRVWPGLKCRTKARG